MAVFEEREDWHAARSRGIASTDIAAIVGLSPWKKSIDVFVNKTEERKTEEPNEFMWWGSYLEAGVTQRYADTNHCTILRGEQIVNAIGSRAHAWNGTAIVKHAMFEELLCSPDGLILHHDRGLEIKTAGWKGDEWGRQGTDEIPIHYLIQCAWCMAMCDRGAWDLAVLFGGNRMENFTVHRNMELEKTLIDAARAFWSNHVLTRIPPPIDASEQYASYLARKFSIGADTVIEATDDITAWAKKLKAAQERSKAAALAEQESKNHLMSLLGTMKGAKGDFGKVTWVRPKASIAVDYEGAFKSLADKYAAKVGIDAPAQIEEIVRGHTEEKPKTAFLKATFAKGE